MRIPLWPAALTLAVAVAATLAACGTAPARTVPGWIAEHAAPLVTADPTAPLDDLEALRRAVGDAQVVGLGESVHGAAELVTLKHPALRLLVERMGFRTVAWEEDWTTDLLIDEYLRTGTGDLDALLARMSPQYRSGEVADVLAWLRGTSTPRAGSTTWSRRLAHPPGDRAHAVALHHARQIRSFYEHFATSDAEALVLRDARAAENLAWWQELTGDRVAYWAAGAHTADAAGLHIAVPPEPDMVFPSAGSHLRDRYGSRYLSIVFTVDHGAVGLGAEQTAELAPPRPDRFEHPLGQAGPDRFVLDVRDPAPPPVRAWLDAPIRARGLPDSGPDSALTGGSGAEWFDVIVHSRLATPVHPV